MWQNVESNIVYYITAKSLHRDWIHAIKVFIKQVVSDIYIDSFSKNTSIMDPNQFIKIKIIPYVNEEATNYFKGVVCRKNVVHKKMRVEFLKPNILLLQGALDI